MAIRVPLEIAELIIDEVSLLNERNSALKACALTCRDFLKPSQHHLFSFVNLLWFSEDDSLDIYLRFKDVITSSPDLALYVQKLFISDNSDDPKIVIQPTILDTFHLLKNLREFHLSIDHGLYSWNSFTIQFKQAFIAILSLPSISNLSIHCVNYLPSVLVKWIATIPNVQLSWMSFCDPDLIVDDDFECPNVETDGSNLKHLTIFGFPYPSRMQSIFKHLSSPECKLEKLSLIPLETGDIVIAQNMMNRTRVSLTALECYRIDDESLLELDIGVLSNLQTMKFWTGSEINPYPNYFENIVHVFAKIRKDNEIREIIIERRLDRFSHELEVERGGLESLDNLLSGLPFGGLQKVHFMLVVYESRSPEEIDIVKLLLRKYLPGIQRKGLLQVDII